jgi:DNA-binding MarR family transcriptional regulator
MTPPQPILRVRRDDLVRALALSATELRVLVLLLTRACPTTGRVWDPGDRIAELLDLPVSLVEDALHALAARDFLEEHPTLMRELRCVELGPVLLRNFAPPDNLPVERSAL